MQGCIPQTRLWARGLRVSTFPPATFNLPTLLASPEQRLDIFACERFEHAGVRSNKLFNKFTFAILEMQNLLFNRVAGHEFIDKDRFFLTDAVGAVGCCISTAGFHQGSTWMT